MNAFFRKLRWLVRRPARDADLREELRFHLEEDDDSEADEQADRDTGAAKRPARTRKPRRR